MTLRPFKRIKDQEKKIEELLKIINDYEHLEEDRKKKKKEGLHKCGFICKGCQNLITDGYYGYACKLDCKCEDRNESNYKR